MPEEPQVHPTGTQCSRWPGLGIKFLVFQVAFKSCYLANTCCLSNSFASGCDNQPLFLAARTHLRIMVLSFTTSFPYRDPYSRHRLVSPTMSHETPQIVVPQCILHTKLAYLYRGSRSLTHELAIGFINLIWDKGDREAHLGSASSQPFE